MGFSYERGVGEMLEDFGHRTEGTMRRVYGRGGPRPGNAWENFTLYDKITPGRAACGNVHYAPNSASDNDWSSAASVASSCDDWLDYPNITGSSRAVSCPDWGCEIRAHHTWWLSHLPHAPGRGPDGKLADWWRYVADFENAR